jgi:aerobic carbon-monoxide dehydrogenase medium subunit
MLNPFRMAHPTTVAEAAGELARLGDAAKIYAGGAELLLLLRRSLIQTDTLIDIKRIRGLAEIAWDGKVVRIGATATHHRLETDARVREHLPMFAHAESQVANIRVRNQGTLGGNLCFSDPHSDPGTALLVYDTKVAVCGPAGERHVSLGDFLVGMYATALSPEELLTRVDVAPLPAGWGSAYLRVHRSQRPTLGVAAAACLADGRLDGVRLAVGCVGPKPERLTELEKKIGGLTMSDAQRVIAEAKAYLAALLHPVDDLLGSADYKVHVAAVLLGKALRQATGNGGEPNAA